MLFLYMRILNAHDFMQTISIFCHYYMLLSSIFIDSSTYMCNGSVIIKCGYLTEPLNMYYVRDVQLLLTVNLLLTFIYIYIYSLI